MDNDSTYKEMSKDRIIEALKELKHEMFKRTPSKYFFALGHAIRFIEKDLEERDANNRSRG